MAIIKAKQSALLEDVAVKPAKIAKIIITGSVAAPMLTPVKIANEYHAGYELPNEIATDT